MVKLMNQINEFLIPIIVQFYFLASIDIIVDE